MAPRTKKTKSVSRSEKANLVFPVGRIHRYMRERSSALAPRVGNAAPVFFAGLLEYLVAEVLELSGNVAHNAKKSRIVPRHIFLAVKNDAELNKLFCNKIIANGGVMPDVQYALKPRRKTTVKDDTDTDG